MTPPAEQSLKCACPSCRCPVDPAKAVTRDGKLYCSQPCAYECTETTCVCVHDCCEDDDEDGRRGSVTHRQE